MTARFEIVRTNAKQPWHARLVAANGRILFTSENYARRRSALAVVGAAFRAAGVQMNNPPTPDVAKDRYIGAPLFADCAVAFEIREVDERTPPAAPLVAEAPFYLGRSFTGNEFWHDRDYHWRFCYGDECTEGAPEFGTEIKVRVGIAIHKREVTP